MLKQLRKLFEGNGASELQNPPPVAPTQREATLFISKAMRLVPYRDRLTLAVEPFSQKLQTPPTKTEEDLENDVIPPTIREQMKAILGVKADQNNICDDYLELDLQRKEEIAS